MKRPVATCIVCIGLCSAAQAVEWSMESTLSDTITLSDNPFLSTVPAWGLGSLSTIVGNLTGRTKTSRFDFDADFNYSKYWGPGAVGSLAETKAGGARAHYETFGKLSGDRNYVDATWRRASTALAVFNELNLPSNASGFIDTYTVQGGIDRSLTATDFWTLSSRATTTTFQPPTAGTQFYDVGMTSTFRHQSNSTAALTALSEFEWLKYDNLTQSQLMIIRQMVGLSSQPYRLLDVVISGGTATVIAEQGNSLPSINPLVPALSSAVATGFIGNAQVSYKLFPTTSISLSAGRSVAPSVTGVLFASETATASLSYQINSLSSLSAQVYASRQQVSGSQTGIFGASTTYSTVLARDWNLNLSYRYTHRGASTGTPNLTFDPLTGIPIFLNATAGGAASSNTVSFGLSKRFVILPRRT